MPPAIALPHRQVLTTASRTQRVRAISHTGRRHHAVGNKDDVIATRHFVDVSHERWIDMDRVAKSARRQHLPAPRPEELGDGASVAVVQWAHAVKEVRDRRARSLVLPPERSARASDRASRAFVRWSRCVPTTRAALFQ